MGPSDPGLAEPTAFTRFCSESLGQLTPTWFSSPLPPSPLLAFLSSSTNVLSLLITQ